MAEEQMVFLHLLLPKKLGKEENREGGRKEKRIEEELGRYIFII